MKRQKSERELRASAPLETEVTGRKFIVWNVFGYSRGTLTLLATFPFPQQADAVAFASTVQKGYVLRGSRGKPCPDVETVAVPDLLTVATKTAKVSEQSFADTTGGIPKTRVTGWTV